MAGKAVLIVDDEPDMADFLKAALGAEGYEVDSAGSAKELASKLKTMQADMILLDMGMSDLDPNSPAEDVRNRTRTRAKILILTGRDIAAERHEGHLKGADGALQKGSGGDAIVSAVKDLLPE